MDARQSTAAPVLPRRVLITGANGFIGRAVFRHLRASGVSVRGIDLRADPTGAVRAGSTLHPQTWSDELAGVDAVVHTAALVSNVAAIDEIWRANVLATRRVLEAAARAQVPRFVHLSSIAAFGFDYPDGADETYPARVNGSTYVDTKVAAEAVVLAAHAADEIDCTIIRPGDVYGPGSRPWVLLPLQLIRTRRMVLPAHGLGVFTPVYVDTLVDGICRAASSPDAAGHIFTMTDGPGVRTQEYFGHLAAMVGRSVPTLSTPAALAFARMAGGTLRALGQDSEISAVSVRMLARPGSYSIAKARRLLGYEPKVPLAEGMRRVEAWARPEGLLQAAPRAQRARLPQAARSRTSGGVRRL